ncbi:hypothetical protein TSUD_57120 [Trifolium subterraneum]|uniref:Uncharacterized protein n=1 Tax=Trifolium subterraneum TaxID=3900 RepID=A0A2Z6MZU2_TRISU|nr:hypothetical protein TSUD_57120 [Trifolium subterraneum]
MRLFQELSYPPSLKKLQLADAIYLKDAIDDLPPVNNDESQDERSYGTTPHTEFQKYISD